MDNKNINYDKIENSFVFLQKQLRDIIDNIYRLKKLKMIEEEACNIIISQIIQLNHMLIDNQYLLINEYTPKHCDLL